MLAGQHCGRVFDCIYVSLCTIGVVLKAVSLFFFGWKLRIPIAVFCFLASTDISHCHIVLKIKFSGGLCCFFYDKFLNSFGVFHFSADTAEERASLKIIRYLDGQLSNFVF